MLPLVTRGSLPATDVPITETWYRADWSYFDTYQGITDGSGLGRNGNSSYPFGLNTQQHIDLRAFKAEGWTGPGITTGPVSTLNNWPGATIALPVGTSTYQSVTDPIDLTVLGDGSLTVALPNFPLGSITLNESYLDLSSDGFSQAICSLSWANSTPSPSSGNTSLTWAYSALQGIDLTQVNGVRLRITATAATTVYLLALRLIGSGWVQTNVDFDSYNGELRQCIPLDGDPTITVPSNQNVPILLRSSLPAGDYDPSPINGSVGVLFNTGSQQQSNAIRLYMRELTTAYLTQIDLEGDTQISLTGQPQPTSGVSEYMPRTMGDLDQLTMSEMNQNTMLNLERTQDPQYISWQAAILNWGPSNASSVQLTNSTGATGYTYSATAAPALSANTTYLMVFSLNDINAQMIIYNVDQVSLGIQNVVFDSGVIADASMFTRRGGRVGFQATLGDGDAYLRDIRPMGMTFAQYQSEPLASITPVMGAQLYVHDSTDSELFSEWTAEGAADVTADTTRSTTGSSARITIGASTTVANNFCPNPSFEHDTVGAVPALWDTADANWSSTASGAALTVVNSTAEWGIQSCQITTSGDAQGPVINLGVLKAGDYRATIWLKGNAGGEVVSLAAGTNASPGVNQSLSLTTTWTSFSTTFTADGLSPCFLAPRTSGGAVSYTWFMDGAMVTPSDYFYSTFFDGDSPGYAWQGTAGQSITYVVNGVVSNSLSPDDYSGITDFDHLTVSFDLWIPSALAQDNPLNVNLKSTYGGGVDLVLPQIRYDHWQHIELSVPQKPILSGIYQLRISYQGSEPGRFWVDNVHVAERSVAWSARSVADDPWQSIYAPWTPFGDFINDDSAGVRFYPQGKQLQMQAEARKPSSAVLSAPKLIPAYAQLGRFAWPEDALGATTGPTAAITGTLVSGSTYTFDGSGSTPGDVAIINWQWSFSDGGYASGPHVQHTFTTSPPQYATLVVTDAYGKTGIVQWEHA